MGKAPVLNRVKSLPCSKLWDSRRFASAVRTTVPVHAGRDISPILLRQIAKDIGLTLDELLEVR
jgi:hypothetical protein